MLGNPSAAGARCAGYLYDVEELVAVNAAVSVHIIQLEIPAQLVLHLSSHHQAERGHILHEVDVAVLQKQVRRWWGGQVKTVPIINK